MLKMQNLNQCSIDSSLQFYLQFWSSFSSFLWLFSKFVHSFLKDWISFQNPYGSLTGQLFSLAGLLSKDSLGQQSSVYLYILFLGQEPSLVLPLALVLSLVGSSIAQGEGRGSFLSQKLYQVLQVMGLGLLFQFFLYYLDSFSWLVEVLAYKFLRQAYKFQILTFYRSLIISLTYRHRQRLFQCQGVPDWRCGRKFLLMNSWINWANSLSVTVMSCKQQKFICCISIDLTSTIQVYHHPTLTLQPQTHNYPYTHYQPADKIQTITFKQLYRTHNDKYLIGSKQVQCWDQSFRSASVIQFSIICFNRMKNQFIYQY